MTNTINGIGDASNNLSLQGASASVDATMSQADDTAAVWTGSLTDDIDITVKSSPEIHGITGETMEGISVDVGYDTETGTEVAEDEIVNWGTELVLDTEVGTFIEGEHVRIFADGGTTVKNGGQILYTAAGAMIVALDNITLA